MAIFTDLDPQPNLSELGFNRGLVRPSSFDTTPEMSNSFNQGTTPANILSGEFPAIIFNGKRSFDDTTAGFRMGLDSDDETYKWIIGDSLSSADWNVTTPNTFTINSAAQSNVADLLVIQTNPASTNTVLEMLRIDRRTTGVAASGLGTAITFWLENSIGENAERARIEHKWSPVDTDSYFSIVSSAAIDSDRNVIVDLLDSSSYAASVGGGIGFGGKYNLAGDYAGFAGIKGTKDNSTDGNYAGSMYFQTRVNGGILTNRMRITADGGVEIKEDTVSFDTASYASFGVTRATTAGNLSYIGLTRSASYPWGIGVTSGNSFIIGNAQVGGTIASAAPLIHIDTTGNLGIHYGKGLLLYDSTDASYITLSFNSTYSSFNSNYLMTVSGLNFPSFRMISNAAGASDYRWETSGANCYLYNQNNTRYNLYFETSTGKTCFNGTDLSCKFNFYNTGAETGICIIGDVAQQQVIYFKDSAVRWAIYKPASSTDLRFFNGTTDKFTFSNAGALVIAAPATPATTVLYCVYDVSNYMYLYPGSASFATNTSNGNWAALRVSSSVNDHRAIDGVITGSGCTGVYADASGTSSTGVRGAGTSYDFYAAGAGTDYGTSSTIKIKKEIKQIQSALNKVLQLNPVSYKRKDDDLNRDKIGLIAEEVVLIVPEVVGYDVDGQPNGISYGGFTPLLIQAIKELNDKITLLKNKI